MKILGVKFKLFRQLDQGTLQFQQKMLGIYCENILLGEASYHGNENILVGNASNWEIATKKTKKCLARYKNKKNQLSLPIPKVNSTVLKLLESS